MNNTLQSLRFVFVMMIVMSHFTYHETSFEAGGDCGVAFFFILSGFVLSMGYGQTLEQKTFRFSRFIKRRLLKLYPLHLLCLTVFLVLFHPTIDHRLPLNALLLHSWIPDDSYYFSYNGVSWFLSCLLFFYLLFPLAYRWANRFTLAIVLSLCIITYIIVPYDRVNAILYVSPLVRFADFFFGIMLYKFCHNGQEKPIPSWVEPVLVILLVVTLAVYPFTDEKLRNAPLYWLVLLPFIYVFARQQGLVSRWLRCPVLQWLGSLSMPIFLLHPMVFRALFHFFPSLPYVLMLVLCLTIIFAFSWVVDRLFLRPIERIR